MDWKPTPRWVVAGGCSLAFLSAAVNAVFLIRFGTSVSHLTGDISKVAVETLEGAGFFASSALNLLIAAAGFVSGAIAAGFWIHHPTLEFSRPYGRAVTAAGGCLMIAYFTLTTFPVLSVGFASFACGLQNSLANRYRGMILRTTHVTGLMTDLGTGLGMKLRGHQVDAWRIQVPAALVLSFFAGALLGAALTFAWRELSLLLLAGLYITGGIGWTIRRHLPVPGISRK